VTRAIHLLGPPRVIVDGEPAPPPRGRKAWALLAYLVVTRAPVPRERLASLLFADAEDPLGALRWNLAEARRLLGDAGAIGGSPVQLTLAAGTTVDLRALAGGSCEEALSVPGLGQELLEGMSFSGCPSFETWLLNERRHVEGLAGAALHEGALARLAAGAPDEAAGLAARLVALSPYDEAAHELLIRSYAAGGDRERAALQLAACIETFRRELGREPSPTVLEAVHVEEPSPVRRAVSGRGAALADLEAGEAAIAAGVADAGLQCLRRAADESRRCSDPGLQARATLALAEALTWTTRGTQEEVASALHETVALARSSGESGIAAQALYQLGFLEMMHAHYERSNRFLDQADAEPGLAPELAGRIALQRAWNLADVGRYRAALDLLDRAGGAAVALADQDLEAMCLGERGRFALLTHDAATAREPLEQSLALTRRTGRASYLPFPLALLGRVAVVEGRHEDARDLLEQALALGVEQGDPCWQALGLSGLGLLAHAEGDPQAPALCDEGVRRTGGVQLHWGWVYGWALETRAGVGIAYGDARAAGWVDELEAYAGRTGMRDHLARAHLHRHALGDGAALGAASLVAASVESPRLAADIATARGSALRSIALR
jgi:DNA-binding SARP family transcriptional activator